jgi:hypothetical protein
MKKGLLIWKATNKTKNIGDYVQSIAAEQYTGPDVTFVQREQLHEYAGEPLKLIMNGWFMLFPENWPPSEKIIPLLQSIHLNPAMSDKLLNEKGIAFLKKWGPVGCRDKGTEKLLKSKGIDAFYSACLTLTLGKTYKHNPESKRVCFNEPYFETSDSRIKKLGYLFTILTKRKTIFQISSKMFNSTAKKYLFRAAAFYQTYSQYFDDELLANAEYVTHLIRESTLGSEENKLETARNILRKYADSSLVISSRIHASLPCVGMGTPVIFVVNDDLRPGGKGLQPLAPGRLEGLIDHLNVMECVNNKLKPILGFEVNGKIGLNHSIKNKNNHLKLAAELDKKCTAFINSRIEVDTSVGV